MYPNLYYVFKDWFGVEWHALYFLNTFGLMVAVSFVVAAAVLSSELKRKEKQGLLFPREENIVVGEPASFMDLFINGFMGFLFGYKFLGLFLSKPDNMNAQEFIFSAEGSLLGGLLAGGLLVFIKWREKKKLQLEKPEKRILRIWPHDRVGDIIMLGLVFGILGAKLFDNLEHWSTFWENPLRALLSPSGLTFYGGLILATIAILIFAYRKGIAIKHLVDAAAPALMIAYALGRVGCQVSGDGDWGIYNSAYVNNEMGQPVIAANNDFENGLRQHATYFLEGRVGDTLVTDRVYQSLQDVPHKHFKGPEFLPTWFFAYSYPQNVNRDGILIPGITDEHNRVLPSPVFPTPLYEFLICTIMFVLLWLLRKKINLPLVMFGVYLLLNGVERYCIEMMRVNNPYTFIGIKATQAQWIALVLALTGIALVFYARYSKLSNGKTHSSNNS